MKAVTVGFLCLMCMLGCALSQYGYGAGGRGGGSGSWGFLGLIGLLVIVLVLFNGQNDDKQHFIVALNMSNNLHNTG